MLQSALTVVPFEELPVGELPVPADPKSALGDLLAMTSRDPIAVLIEDVRNQLAGVLRIWEQAPPSPVEDIVERGIQREAIGDV